MHEPMFGNLNTRLGRQHQRENFTRRNVVRVFRFGKLCHRKPLVGQTHRRLRTRPTQRRTSAEQKPQAVSVSLWMASVARSSASRRTSGGNLPAVGARKGLSGLSRLVSARIPEGKG